MSKHDKRDAQPAVGEGTGAKGGKDALNPEQQQPMGFEPDSEVDEKLRESAARGPSGLNPNTIVRNG